MTPKHYVIAVILALLGATLLHALVCPSSTINPTSTDVLMIEEEYDPADLFVVDPGRDVFMVNPSNARSGFICYGYFSDEQGIRCHTLGPMMAVYDVARELPTPCPPCAGD